MPSGDPPNVVIGSRAGLSFNDFLLHMAPIVIVMMIVFVLMSRAMFRKTCRYDARRSAGFMERREAGMPWCSLWARISAAIPRSSPSSANVVVTGIAQREGHRISFWQFSRYGLVVTAVTAIAGSSVWLRYFAFA